jgi:hypothetical protein
VVTRPEEFYECEVSERDRETSPASGPGPGLGPLGAVTWGEEGVKEMKTNGVVTAGNCSIF